MKYKTLSIVQILACAAVLLTCSKSTEPSANENDITVVIQNSDIYEYRTGVSGDEDRVIISQQAKHYEISEIVRGKATNFEAVYRYKPQDMFKGSDVVELEKQTGSDGASPPKRFETVRIIIRVH